MALPRKQSRPRLPEAPPRLPGSSAIGWARRPSASYALIVAWERERLLADWPNVATFEAPAGEEWEEGEAWLVPFGSPAGASQTFHAPI